MDPDEDRSLEDEAEGLIAEANDADLLKLARRIERRVSHEELESAVMLILRMLVTYGRVLRGAPLLTREDKARLIGEPDDDET